jgi:ankyrin repeat protein
MITLVLNDEPEPGDTRLHEAIAAGDRTKVQELIRGAANVHYIGNWGCTPLELAIELGNLDIVQDLLTAGAQVDFGVGSAPLEMAVRTGKIDIVNILISAGANLNEDLGDNHTVLMAAAAAGHLNIVQLLIEKGADPNAIREDGASALLCATSNGWQEVFDYLALLTLKELLKQAAQQLPAGLIYRQRKDNQINEEFVLAAGEGRIDDVKKLLVVGADINAIDSNGNTALCFAAYWGQSSVVRFLVEAGASLEMKDEQSGWTPLIAAIGMGQFDVVQFLLESGADIDNVDRDGQTALMLAATLNFSAKYPGSRLFPKNFFRHIEIFKYLLEFGADVNAKTDSGGTALMAATMFRNIKAVELLLQAGAEVNAKDNRGDTALSLAREAGHQEIVKLLKEAGAEED